MRKCEFLKTNREAFRSSLEPVLKALLESRKPTTELMSIFALPTIQDMPRVNSLGFQAYESLVIELGKVAHDDFVSEDTEGYRPSWFFLDLLLPMLCMRATGTRVGKKKISFNALLAYRAKLILSGNLDVAICDLRDDLQRQRRKTPGSASETRNEYTRETAFSWDDVKNNENADYPAGWTGEGTTTTEQASAFLKEASRGFLRIAETRRNGGSRVEDPLQVLRAANPKPHADDAGVQPLQHSTAVPQTLLLGEVMPYDLDYVNHMARRAHHKGADVFGRRADHLPASWWKKDQRLDHAALEDTEENIVNNGPETAAQAVWLMHTMVMGLHISDETMRWARALRGLAIKTGNKDRPIGIGNSNIRDINGLRMRKFREDLDEVAARLGNFLLSSDGTMKAARSLRLLHQSKPDLIGLTRDVIKAYQTYRRDLADLLIRKFYPHLLHTNILLYGEDPLIFVHGNDNDVKPSEVDQTAGGAQGCTLTQAPFLLVQVIFVTLCRHIWMTRDADGIQDQDPDQIFDEVFNTINDLPDATLEEAKPHRKLIKIINDLTKPTSDEPEYRPITPGYADDMCTLLPPEAFVRLLECGLDDKLGARTNLILHKSTAEDAKPKSVCYSLSPDSMEWLGEMKEALTELGIVPLETPGIFLGVSMAPDASAFMEAKVNDTLQFLNNTWGTAAYLQEMNEDAVLSSFSAAVGRCWNTKLDHIARVLPPSQTVAPLRRYHKGIRRLTEKLLGITFHNMDWFIYCLPQHCGGHGLTNPADKATAAYIGAYISMFSTDLVATTGGVLKPRLLKTFPDLKDLMNDRGDPAESETDRKELKTLWEEHFSTMTIIRRHRVDLLEKVMQIRRAHNPNYVPEFDLDAMLHTPVPLKAACLLSITMWKGPQRIITQAMYRAIFECIIGTSKENKIHLHLGNKSTRDSRNRLKRLLSCG